MKMKNNDTYGLKILLAGLMMFSLLCAENKGLTPEEKAAKFQLTKNALRTKISADTIAKSYIFIGEKIGTRQATKEKKKGLKKFKVNFTALEKSINNAKIKNLLVYMRYSYDELIETVEKPYSFENAQIVLDLSTSVGEGAKYIAEKLRDETGRDPIIFDGLVPNVETIAKYYVAYTAGIRDENTVSLMKDAVTDVGLMIEKRVKSQGNTVAMNQDINKAKHLWAIVYKFYLDIDNNGLPFIVLKTTTDLKKVLTKYNFAYIHKRATEIKAGK